MSTNQKALQSAKENKGEGEREQEKENEKEKMIEKMKEKMREKEREKEKEREEEEGEEDLESEYSIALEVLSLSQLISSSLSLSQSPFSVGGESKEEEKGEGNGVYLGDDVREKYSHYLSKLQVGERSMQRDGKYLHHYGCVFVTSLDFFDRLESLLSAYFITFFDTFDILNFALTKGGDCEGVQC